MRRQESNGSRQLSATGCPKSRNAGMPETRNAGNEDPEILKPGMTFRESKRAE